MKCPKKKCGFISFDYLSVCKKCGTDLTQVRQELGLPDVEPSIPFTLDLLTGGGEQPAEVVKPKKVLSLDTSVSGLEPVESDHASDISDFIEEEISMDLSTRDLDKFIEETESNKLTPMGATPELKPKSVTAGEEILAKSQEPPSDVGLSPDLFEGDTTRFAADELAQAISEPQPPPISVKRESQAETELLSEEKISPKAPKTEAEDLDLDMNLDFDLDLESDISDLVSDLGSQNEVQDQTRFAMKPGLDLEELSLHEEEAPPKTPKMAADDTPVGMDSDLGLDLDLGADLEAELSGLMEDIGEKKAERPSTEMEIKLGAAAKESPLPVEGAPRQTSKMVTDDTTMDLDLDLGADLESELSGLMEDMELEEKSESSRVGMAKKPDTVMKESFPPGKGAPPIPVTDSDTKEINLDLDADLSSLMDEIDSRKTEEPRTRLVTEPEIALEDLSLPERVKSLRDSQSTTGEIDLDTLDLDADLSGLLEDMEGGEESEPRTKLVAEPEISIEMPSREEKPSKDEEDLIRISPEDSDQISMDFEKDLAAFMQDMETDSFETQTELVPSSEFKMEDSKKKTPKDTGDFGDITADELDLDDLIKELEKASTE